MNSRASPCRSLNYQTEFAIHCTTLAVHRSRFAPVCANSNTHPGGSIARCAELATVRSHDSHGRSETSETVAESCRWQRPLSRLSAAYASQPVGTALDLADGRLTQTVGPLN